jgi:hypothetical protein
MEPGGSIVVSLWDEEQPLLIDMAGGAKQSKRFGSTSTSPCDQDLLVFVFEAKTFQFMRNCSD